VDDLEWPGASVQLTIAKGPDRISLHSEGLEMGSLKVTHRLATHSHTFYNSAVCARALLYTRVCPLSLRLSDFLVSSYGNSLFFSVRLGSEVFLLCVMLTGLRPVTKIELDMAHDKYSGQLLQCTPKGHTFKTLKPSLLLSCPEP
jgi:hypothetical protein